MVAVSLYFCAWVDVRFALLLVASAAVNGLLANAAARALDLGDPTPASRRCVAAAVVVDVAVLGLFTYHGFFLGSVTDVFDALGLSATAPTLGLLVLVGLSVVTLHAIGYVVDVGRGDVEPVAWGDVPLYLCFFPHLVAGPPVRVDELVRSSTSGPTPVACRPPTPSCSSAPGCSRRSSSPATWGASWSTRPSPTPAPPAAGRSPSRCTPSRCRSTPASRA